MEPTPFSGPEATHSSNLKGNSPRSPTDSSHLDDKAANFLYVDGELSWSGGSLKSNDVVTVTRVDGSSTAFVIFSLTPSAATSSKSESSHNPSPFELRLTPATNLPQEFLHRYLFGALPTQLDPSNTDIHILVSTLSGTGLAPDFFEHVLQHLLKAIGLDNTKYNVVKTKSAESVKDFASSVLFPVANKGRNQSILMLSGDGGMLDTINGLMEHTERLRTYVKPVLTQLPLGTGNALFHSLHKPSNLPSMYIQGLRTLLHGTPRSLPIFQAVFSPGARLLSNKGQTATPIQNSTLCGAVVASYGLHATLVADSDTIEYRKHGDKRFGLVANDLLFPPGGAQPHAYQAVATLFKPGGENIEINRKEHGYILASLVSNLEKAFAISPASLPLDGQLRVVHFGAISGKKTMEIMGAAYNSGGHVGMEWEDEKGIEKVGYEDIERLRIKFKEKGDSWKWRRCCVDGLIVGVEENGWMEVSMVKSDRAAVDVVFDT